MRFRSASITTSCVAYAIALAAGGPGAHGAITYTSQSRVISAVTTADLNMVTASAPDFTPFNEFVESSALFTGPLGVPRINRARTTITSILDSNSVQTDCEFTCDGGENDDGDFELGEASIEIFITFTLAESTPFHLFSSARPGLLDGDEFELELNRLEDGGGTEDIFALDETAPPQIVDLTGTLVPGNYTLQLQVEFSAASPDQIGDYEFFLNVPSPASVVPFAAGAIFALRRRRR